MKLSLPLYVFFNFCFPPLNNNLPFLKKEDVLSRRHALEPSICDDDGFALILLCSSRIACEQPLIFLKHLVGIIDEGLTMEENQSYASL